ncbi:hypothetical protein P7C70_g2948, partial [Phenoliferia sp. Uapishka_3]
MGNSQPRKCEINNVSLLEATKSYSWSKKKGYKLRPRAPSRIVRVYPAYSAKEDHDKYEDHCRARLQLHHPYRGDLMVLQRDPESGDDIVYIEAYRICQEKCGGHPFDPLPNYEEENKDSEPEQEDSDDIAGQGPASLRLGTRELDLAYDWRDKANLYLNAALMKSYINEMKKLWNRADDREDLPPLSVHIDGTAGTGKSFLITAISTALKDAALTAPLDDKGKSLTYILRLAPSGIAAYNIRGKTILTGLSIPVTLAQDYLPVTPTKLIALQSCFQHLRYIIVDERSMVGQKLFGRLSLRLQERDDPESVTFETSLTNLRAQSVTETDYDLLSSRSFKNLSAAEVSTFNDAIHSLTRKEDVAIFNEHALQRARKPVLKVYAEHRGGAAAEKASANEARGMEKELYLMEGAKVMLTSNLWTAKGTIEHVIYAEGKKPRNHPGVGNKPNLPLAVLLHIPGYEGPTRWHRADGEPLVPISPTLPPGKDHKGLTLDRVVIHLGKSEFQRGLAFVACSRVRNLRNLTVTEYIPPARLLNLGKSNRGANGGRIAGPWERDVERRELLGFADDRFGGEERYLFAEDA